MNKVFLIGNLTRDPELTETSGGVNVCHFAIAVNRSYTSADGERQTDFFNEDNQGVKRNAVDIIAQDVEFLTQKNANSGDDFYDSPAPSERSAAPAKKKPTLESLDDDGDIPF